MKKKILGILALILSTFALNAQQNCFNLSIDSEAASPGDTVCLSIRVNNFNDILGIQTGFEWDDSKLDFISVDNFNLPGMAIQDFNIEGGNVGPGRAAFSWFNPSFTGVTLTDNTAIFDFCFEVIGNDGYGEVKFISDPNFLVTEIILESSDLVNSFSLLGGGVSIDGAATLPVSFAGACQDAGDCNSGSNLTVAVAGGTPPYAYVWSQGNVVLATDANFNDAPSGQYELQVTDADGDQISGLFRIDNGEGLTISNLIQTQPSCGDANGAIAVEVAGGSGDYDFAWSNGATTPYNITGLVSGDYGLTITDNNTGCTASFSIELLSEGLITAYTYECTLFPNGTALADFTTLVWSDGQTPYTFTWSTGFTETTNEMVSTLQDADPDGTYAVTITDDNGCTGILENMTADCSGLTTLVYIPSDNVQVGEQFCLPVKINNINAITRFDAALTWSTDHLSFNGVNEGSLTALLTDGLDLSQTDAGQLTVQWDTDIPEGEMLENDDTLFEICFEAVGDPGTQTDVAFDDNILPGYVENGAELPATFQEGTFTILDGFLTAYSLNCTYFGDNTAQASISCAVWTGGVPPYTFNWNTGYSVQDTLFSTLENVPANTTYSLTITDAEGTTHIPDPIFADCGGQGGTDDVTLNIESATVVPGEDVCLDITVDNFTDIGSIQFSVNWDTDYLNFEQIELSNNLPGLDLASGFNLNLTDEGTIAMSWFEPSINTISLADGSTLFTICFQAGTQSGTTPVTFSPNPVSIEVTDLENTLPVTLQNGTVEVLPTGVWSTAYSYDCLQFGDGTAQASVSCVVWAGGTPPYTFDWSTGFSEQDTLFSTLENVPANTTYSLTITDAEGNTYIPDAVFPDCNVSNEDATVTIGEAIVNPMANFCVPVTISGVSEVTSLEAGIAWLPGIINYTGITGGVLGDETSFTIEDSNLGIGQISIMWEATAPDAILVNDGDVLFELCFDAVGTSGSSTGISFSEAVHPFALGNVSGTIVTPVDGGCFISGTGGPDDVTLTIESAVVDTGEVVCLDVSVANFTDIGSLQFSITWDTDYLQYDTIQLANNLPGLTLASGFNLNLVDDGIVALAWFEPSINTVSLADGSTLFTLCLQADTLEGPTPVTFSPTPVNIEVTDLENTLPVVLQNGTVDVLQPEVWPGDTDVDGLVTHFDLLNIGLGFGAAGPERNNATIAWEAQFAPGWTASTPVSNINYKHLDTNGDGFIDAADTLALVSNWGEEVNLLPEDENRMMTGSIYIEPDTVVLGEQTTFNIMLGEPGNLVPEVYGIAFTIVYDSAAVAPGSASTSFLDSWIGNANEDLIGLSRDRFDDSRIDVAITRTDGINAEGSGAIGQLHITIQDVIFMRGEDYPLEFDVENIRLINADETDFQVTGLPSSGIVKDGIVNTTAPEQNNFEVQAFPNPANDLLRILVRGAQLEEARLIATDGRLVHRAQQRTSEINVQNLPEGLYMLQVVTDKGQTTQRIVITH